MSSWANEYRPSSHQLTYRTGKHVVANLYCMACDTLLGWMYISAPNGHEKYKEGM